MQQAVEDRGGEEHVAGEQIVSVALRLVCCDQGRVAAGANVSPSRKNKLASIAIHGLEAKLFDDKQCR